MTRSRISEVEIRLLLNYVTLLITRPLVPTSGPRRRIDTQNMSVNSDDSDLKKISIYGHYEITTFHLTKSVVVTVTSTLRHNKMVQRLEPPSVVFW